MYNEDNMSNDTDNLFLGWVMAAIYGLAIGCILGAILGIIF